MFGRDFFKDSSAVPVRVVDLCSIKGKEERKKAINTYDKEMSAVLINLRFDKALEKGTNTEVAALRTQLYELIDKAYVLFYDYILFNEHQKTDRQTFITSYLKLIHLQIEEAKSANIHPRELLNLVLIKLSMLRDLSKNESVTGFKEMTLEANGQENKTLSIEDFIERFLAVPLTRDIREIKQLLGSGISSPRPFEHYSDIDKVLPLFSNSGSIGINTILYALYNGYYPIGFGVEPHSAHMNVHHGVIENMRHDNGHNFLRVHQLLTEDPDQFEAYKNAYQQTITKKYNQQVDDLTFKKNLLALFFLTWEISFYPMQTRSAVSQIHARHIIDLIDFVKPLGELGYPVIKVQSYSKKDSLITPGTFFDEKNAIENSVKTNLVSLLADFKNCYPHIGLDLLEDLNDKNLDYAKALLKNPRYINNVTPYSNKTLLHFICERGQVLIAEELLKRGADKNAIDRNGAMPLHLACGSGDLELVKLLLNYGADLCARQKNGSTPLDLAFRSGNSELVIFLLSCNLDSYVKNEFDTSSLVESCAII